jgi:hypothetical protein
MNESLDVSAQQTSLMSPLFAEMPIPSQESQRSFTCLLVVSTTQRHPMIRSYKYFTHTGTYVFH